jgi:hypothetical protein
MAILTEDMKRVVREQRLGFIATVCPDGTPNLSPKGTSGMTTIWSSPAYDRDVTEHAVREKWERYYQESLRPSAGDGQQDGR